MPILTPEERVGTKVAGKYQLDRILAVGGMGTVYAGQHEWTHRSVAVKILNYEHARKPDIVKRFLQEARAAANLRHPNVVDVLDMGEADDGSVYLVLELLEGQTLKARMRKGRIQFSELVELIGPVMDALSEAHAQGVIHRDLKPDNIFLADEKGKIVPKLLDFGIAKVLGDGSQTGTGVMIGTPQYMAPEQVRGDREVGPAADIWSLGVVLFGALSGRLPFRGDSPAATIAKVLVEQAPKLRQVAPTVPRPIAAVIDKALQRLPADRHDSVLAMKRAMIAAAKAAANDFDVDTSADAIPVQPTMQLQAKDLEPEAEKNADASDPVPPKRAAKTGGHAAIDEAALDDTDRTIATPTPAPALAAAVAQAQASADARSADGDSADGGSADTAEPAHTPAPASPQTESAPPLRPSTMPSSTATPSATPYSWSTTSDVSKIDGVTGAPSWWLAAGAAAGLFLLVVGSLTIWGIASSVGDDEDPTPTPRAATTPPPPTAEPDAGVLAQVATPPGLPEDTPTADEGDGSGDAAGHSRPDRDPVAAHHADPEPEEDPVPAADTEEPEEDPESVASADPEPDEDSHTGGRRGRSGRGASAGRRGRREPVRGTGGALILR